MENNKSYFKANKLAWDARTEAHTKSDFYDIKGFKEGKSALGPIVLAELPDVKGKSILHLQCHFGLDSLSLARMGAQVTGVDLSSKAIEVANTLAEETKLNARFIESNVLDMDMVLDETFDIVFLSYGAICWLPDLDAWADQIIKRMKPGGQIYLAEFHPYLYMWDWAKFEINYSYFNRGVYFEKTTGSYTDGSEELSFDEYFWVHPTSDVFTALTKKGIVISSFNEHEYTPYNCFESLEERAPGEHVYKINGRIIPAVFSMFGTYIND